MAPLDSLQDAAWARDRLGLRSIQRAYVLARQGAIPCVRIGRAVRFDPEAIREFMKRGGASLNERATHGDIES